jgi:hypothetical protein
MKSTDLQTILFFDNIDVAYTPRCASSSIRHLWGQVYLPTEVENTNWITFRRTFDPIRKKVISKLRDDSYKIAIIRDPLERFISTCNLVYNHFNIKDEHDLDMPFKPETIAECIELAKLLISSDKHFIPQTNFLDNLKQYDTVIDMNDLQLLVNILQDKMDIKLYLPEINKTKNKKFNLSDMNMEQRKIVMELYNCDYINFNGLHLDHNGIE